jgi:hypothetical protein
LTAITVDALPFSVYDFFGYLAAGFVVLVAATAAFVGDAAIRSNPSVIEDALLIVLAYVAGQVISTISRTVLERGVLARALGPPSDRLFSPSDGWRRRLFPGYVEPLPSEIQARILTRANEQAGLDRPGRALFVYCHARVRRDEAITARLETFLKLHAFCRNMTLAGITAALLLLTGSLAGTAQTGRLAPGVWVAIALATAVGMFYRWLHFYLHFAVEVFTGYAELPGDGPPTP